MRAILFLAIALISLSLSCSKKIIHTKGTAKSEISCDDIDNPKTDLGKQNLRGKISSYKSSVHQAFQSPGKIEYKSKLKTNAVHEAYQFNSSGNTSETLSNYLYPDNANIDDIVIKTICNYDERNRCAEKTIYEAKNTSFTYLRKSTYQYNSIDDIIETSEFQGKSLKRRVIRKVNKEDRTAYEYSYDPNGILTETIYLKYDQADNELERTTSDPKTNKIDIEKKSYDLKNNLITYSYDGKIGKFDCEYSYDDRNNVTDKICKSSLKSRHDHFEYIYDGHCNWIQRVEISDGVPDNVTIRTFQYQND